MLKDINNMNTADLNSITGNDNTIIINGDRTARDFKNILTVHRWWGEVEPRKKSVHRNNILAFPKKSEEDKLTPPPPPKNVA